MKNLPLDAAFHIFGSTMQLMQLVYVSAYLNEYGQDLPKLLENTALANDDGGVLGMTLFSNGNIMQLLEGRSHDVEAIFQKLQRNGYECSD